MTISTGSARAIASGLAAAAALAVVAAPMPAAALKVVSDKAVAGFPFPESVGCDAKGKVLYVSQFVSALQPAEKDGKGRISKVSLTGEVLEQTFLPTAGQVLNKPKGVWVSGNRLWTTDIDVAWVFDLKTRQGRSVALTGAQFANDPAVMGKALYVTDNRADKLFKVEPADFLKSRTAPVVTTVFSGRSINPNGVYPGGKGTLLVAGTKSATEPKGIHSVAPDGSTKPVTKDIGRLDGLYRMKDGSLLATDWGTGSLFHWTAKSGVETLATGFGGPADFCVMPNAQGMLVVVPDLAKSVLRFIQLGK
ncbi:MAG: hypothetical protein IT561_16870 [Alphaproteobacteria bacterium]|nr:hypothetical protein [Alphaproteobacteria bacterium]